MPKAGTSEYDFEPVVRAVNEAHPGTFSAKQIAEMKAHPEQWVMSECLTHGPDMGAVSVPLNLPADRMYLICPARGAAVTDEDRRALEKLRQSKVPNATLPNASARVLDTINRQLSCRSSYGAAY